MPKPASTRPAYKMLTCIYLCRTLLFFAPYADFFPKKCVFYQNAKKTGRIPLKGVKSSCDFIVFSLSVLFIYSTFAICN